MNKERILNETEEYVKREMSKESTGHDYSHIKAVERNAIYIQKREGGDIFIIRMASLIHDIWDSKLHNGDLTVMKKKGPEWLEKMAVARPEAEHIFYIIDNMSFFKSAFARSKIEKSIEFKVVQDADWLESLGATGIIRALQYGGAMGRPLYDPNMPEVPITAENYRDTKDTITHMKHKEPILWRMLNTKTARRVGLPRHKLAVDFLRQFDREYNAQDFEELS